MPALRKNYLAMTGIALLFIIFLMAAIGPSISGYTYYDTHLESKNFPPSPQFWFGTDDLGRDLFTRVCYGARISLFVGISAALIDLIIGVCWGGIAGFMGGDIDSILMRIADILYAIPSLLVVVLLTVIFQPGIITIVLAMAILGWITMARIVRGQILELKQREFVLAATALGAGFGRIFFKHLIPNAMGPVLVTVTYTIPTAIFMEAFLSFLGLGVQAPIASWGTMASEALAALEYYPWRLFFPTLFISMTMFSFNIIGDQLNSFNEAI